jgi:hypothetical protein
MKKLVMLGITLVMGLALVAGNGMACEGPRCNEGPRTADLNLQFQATSDDVDQSGTGWRGNYNDNARATADGYAGGILDVHANADGYTRILWWKIDNPAFVDGTGTASDESKAWSWAKDYGQTSKAGAGAKTSGEAQTVGLAIGLKGCPEYVDSTVYVGGSVNQWNQAGETGYSNGQGVSGGNSSGGWFNAEDRDYESGNGYAFDTNSIEGGMITKGKTEVTIDPTGSHRSFSAMTENMVEVNAPNLVGSSVGGDGSVSGVVQKGSTFAAAASSFSYNGNTYGNGNAQLKANIDQGAHSSTVKVTGSAYSVSNGGNVPN